MKNIHLLPTNKPSRLYTNNGQLHLDSVSTQSNGHTINQNLYITSEEQVKEGDWHLHYYANKAIVGKSTKASIQVVQSSKDYKKVILTTDQTLISEGVQAVDEEFLQWYVKNPTCEYVNVVSLRKSSGYYDEKSIWHWDFLAYKIIIPQEESKQPDEEIRKIADEIWNEQNDLIKDKNVIPEKYAARQMLMMNAHEVIDTRVHKEETLEEAAKKYYEQNIDGSNIPREHWEYEIQDMMVGFASIWQSERMYSEEDLKVAYNEGSFAVLRHKDGLKWVNSDEWFEQFKKK